MNIYITEQFNKSMTKLSEKDQKRVFNTYKQLSNISISDLINSKSLVKIANSKEKVFIYRVSIRLRLFCSFESHNNDSGLIFLDVIEKRSAQQKYPY